MGHCSFQYCKSQTKGKASGFPAEVFHKFTTLPFGDAVTNQCGRLSKAPGLPIAGVEQIPSRKWPPQLATGKHRTLGMFSASQGWGHNKSFSSLSSLYHFFFFIRERRAALLVLYIWGTVSLKPIRYNTRIILSNSRLVFVAFFL